MIGSLMLVLVESDISHSLPDYIKIDTPSGLIHQQIAYD